MFTRTHLYFTTLLLISLVTLTISLETTPTNVELLDPAYNPCQCDLKLDVCDINCCCDTSCTAEDRALFRPSCRTTIRDLITNEIDEWYCSDIYGTMRLQRPNWFPIMCVNSVTTVLLGQFYLPSSVERLVNSDNFKTTINDAVLSTYSYRSAYINDLSTTDSRIKESKFCMLHSNKNYKNGHCVGLKSPTSKGAADFFRFPQAINGILTCSYDQPTRYLIDQPKMSCPIEINTELSFCSSPIVNYKSYTSTDQIIMNRTTNTLTERKLEFWKCNAYAKPSEPTDQNVNPNLRCTSPSNMDCLFNPKSKLFDDKIADLCDSSIWNYGVNRVNDIPLDFDSHLFSQCSKVTSISEPVLIQGSMCQNTVIGVKNLLFWKEMTITKVITQIIVADISYPTSQDYQKFNQIFELKWIHDSIPVESITQYNQLIISPGYISNLNNGLQGISSNENFTDVSGYVNGNVIVSGYRRDNENSTDPVDISYNLRVSTFKSLNGKLCGMVSNLERLEIRFNQNLSSSCLIRVSRPDIQNNCRCLRNLMFNKINDYFVPANFVSKNGNPNMSAFDKIDWLNIFPATRQLNDTFNQTTPTICPDVPYKVSVEFLYARAGKANGTDFNELIGTYLKYSYRDWTFICKSDRTVCFQDDHLQEFEIEFEVKFINTTYVPDKSFFDNCASNPDYSMACLQSALYTWPRDYSHPLYFYLYTVHLGLIGGFFGLMILYFMLFGCICAC